MIYGQPLNLGLAKKSSKVDRAVSILAQRVDCDRLRSPSSSIALRYPYRSNLI
ncbi:hypothetical protein QUA82_10575 [Microcoleus sp. F8-D3]